MKKLIFLTIAMMLCQVIFLSQLVAGNNINISGWNIEIQDDGTCALGKIYNFGDRDSVIVIINSYGTVSIHSDNEFTGIIDIDGANIIQPVGSFSGDSYTYSNSNNIDNGKVFVTYFKLGNVAKIKLKNGDYRSLSLSGFTKAYNQYKKCAR